MSCTNQRRDILVTKDGEVICSITDKDVIIHEDYEIQINGCVLGESTKKVNTLKRYNI